MATTTITIDQTDAPFLQALISQAQTQGKTLAQILDESKASGEPLAFSFTVNGQNLIVLNGAMYEMLKGEALQKAKNQVGKLLEAGLDSGEPTPVTDETWAELRAELHRRSNARKNGASTK